MMSRATMNGHIGMHNASWGGINPIGYRLSDTLWRCEMWLSKWQPSHLIKTQTTETNVWYPPPFPDVFIIFRKRTVFFPRASPDWFAHYNKFPYKIWKDLAMKMQDNALAPLICFSWRVDASSKSLSQIIATSY